MSAMSAMNHAAPAGGPVVLEVGPDAGALIVHVEPDRHGGELHLRRRGAHGSTIHTGIWARAAAPGAAVVAVFASLPVDRWAILDDDGADVREIDIHPGAVTTVDLRGGDAGAPF